MLLNTLPAPIWFEQRRPNEECLELWGNVLVMALQDASGYLSGLEANKAPIQKQRMIDEARHWLKSKCRGIGSFLWVCDILDLAPGPIRAEVLKKSHLNLVKRKQIHRVQ